VHVKPLGTGFLPIMAVGVLLGGCADTMPRPPPREADVSAYRIDADDQPTINVVTAPGVDATEEDRQRLKNLLADKLNARRAHNPANGDPRQCEVDITVTKFESASKLVRATLAGLGRIHLDANVLVVPKDGGGTLGAFRISKTFAWGGFYGASASMEDIELPFADGIAAALTGQPPEADELVAASDASQS